MGKLRPNYINTGTIAGGQTSISIPINNNGYETVWVIEQIAVSYSKAGDTPTVTIMWDGSPFSGPAQMIVATSGLGQSFGGQPYIYAESDDDLEVLIQGGTAGALVTVQVQYRQISYGHDELQGRY